MNCHFRGLRGLVGSQPGSLEKLDRLVHVGVAVDGGFTHDREEDVQAFSDKVAYLLSIGDNPTDFRIYKTTDGGSTWTLQFTNQNPGAFYDGFASLSVLKGDAYLRIAVAVISGSLDAEKTLAADALPRM